ncbi:PRC-barrel domain-containing protein [Jiella sp. MQZ9-1]|uniref:PRC-barrel domain-containing protein n=1 Tax=Jiella flava TaxID=2816857 RepID=A0A939FVS3_9HYPH|nr:PRC-barrel domain-containing protein [Jiella flava]MBO0661764.1 PRC-barrel domain-containing protein [Jiella flava]MCD2470405.1 PRC-barrel domain-containing protein [Jiella flava]
MEIALKPIVSAALAFTLIAAVAGSAVAQDAQSKGQAVDQSAAAASGVLAPISKDDAPVPQLNLMVEQVDDMTIVGPNGEKVGEVEHVLGDANGNAKAITVEVGGFLGIGEKTVILMLSDVALDMGRVKTALTKDEIEKLPAFSN